MHGACEAASRSVEAQDRRLTGPECLGVRPPASGLAGQRCPRAVTGVFSGSPRSRGEGAWEGDGWGEPFLRPPTRGRRARILTLGFLPGLCEKTAHALRFPGSELETWSPAAGGWEARSDPSSSRSWWDAVTVAGSPGKHRPQVAAQGPLRDQPPPLPKQSSPAPLLLPGP